jgi:hypothetical protein
MPIALLEGFLNGLLSVKLSLIFSEGSMIKLFWRLVCFALIAVIAFVVLSLLSGGEKIRWLGRKVERGSEKVGASADKLRGKSDAVLKGIEKAKEKIEDLTGKKREESR